MKKLYAFKAIACLTLITCLFAIPRTVHAQDACNGRYANMIFDSVTITRNIVFGQNTTYSGQTQVLKSDVYYPAADSNVIKPAVFVLYGGSFINGSRNDLGVPQFATELAKRGYVAITIDYRLGIPFPPSGTEMSKAVYRATQDLLAAVRYYRAHADSFDIDSSRIFASGFSAGAITCLHAAFWQQSEVPTAINPAVMGTLAEGSGNPGISGRISGVISAAGGIGDTLWISADEKIPVGSVHNATDPTVPYNCSVLPIVNLPICGSLPVTNRINHLGNEAWLKTMNVPGMHIPDYGTPEADTMGKYMVNYLYRMQPCAQGPLTATNQQQPEHFTLFPNPATDKVSVSFGNAAVAGTIELLNATGRVMLRQNIQAGSGVTSLTLPETANGFYMVRVTEGGRSTSRHLMLNR
ncbi:MAG: T9SS type A sorting domain-containing protein [Bacteroidota bacterium]